MVESKRCRVEGGIEADFNPMRDLKLNLHNNLFLFFRI